MMNTKMQLLAAFLVIFVALEMALAVPVAPTNSPNHQWLFDEGSGTTGADTGTTGGSDATLNFGAGWSANTPFAYSGNSSLDTGAAGNATAPSPSAGSFAGPFTMSVWAAWDGTVLGGVPGNHYIFDSEPSGNRHLLLLNDNNPTNLFWDNQNHGTAGLGALSSNDWSHYAFVSDGIDLLVYEDGNLVSTIADDGGAVNTLFIGSRFSNNEFWRGEIDEFAIWDEALSADNVEWLSQNSLNDLNSAVVPEPASVALWSMLGIAAIGYYFVRSSRTRS